MIAQCRFGCSRSIRRVGLVVPASLTAALLITSPVHHARAETADRLLASPQRLALVQAGCKTTMAWTTIDLWAAAAQATRMRFLRGGVPYTPHTVDLFPTRPAIASPSPSSPPPAVRKPHPKSRTHPHRLARADARPWR